MIKLIVNNYDSFAFNVNSETYNEIFLMKTSRPHSFYKIMTKKLYWDLTYLYNWLPLFTCWVVKSTKQI
jgi:hypothetical protein